MEKEGASDNFAAAVPVDDEQASVPVVVEEPAAEPEPTSVPIQASEPV